MPCSSTQWFRPKPGSRSYLLSFSHIWHPIHQQILLAQLSKYFLNIPLMWPLLTTLNQAVIISYLHHWNGLCFHSWSVFLHNLFSAQKSKWSFQNTSHATPHSISLSESQTPYNDLLGSTWPGRPLSFPLHPLPLFTLILLQPMLVWTPQYTRRTPGLRSLHLLFPLSRIFFPQIAAWITLLPPFQVVFQYHFLREAVLDHYIQTLPLVTR